MGHAQGRSLGTRFKTLRNLVALSMRGLAEQVYFLLFLDSPAFRGTVLPALETRDKADGYTPGSSLQRHLPFASMSGFTGKLYECLDWE